MSNSYVTEINGRASLANVVFDPAGPAVLSRGHRFFQRPAVGPLSPFTPADMIQINEEFHDFLAGDNWQWSPYTPGSSPAAGGRLLDNVANVGECGFVAHALAILLNAPNPWGFNAPPAVPGGVMVMGWRQDAASVTEYTGAHGHGFISRHLHPLPGLTLNIVQPNGQPLNGFYFWPNHKVVDFQNVFYDPNYRTHYVNTAQMAAGMLQRVHQRVRLRDLTMYSGPLGKARLALLKLSDLYWHNSHDIDIFRVVGGHPTINGYYIEWSEVWLNQQNHPNARKVIYGPYPNDPV